MTPKPSKISADPAAAVAEIARLEARVTELLEANNREVERRRDAEHRAEEFARRLTLIEPPALICSGTMSAEEVERFIKMMDRAPIV